MSEVGDQVVRYTGVSGQVLTGIPPSGSGALQAAVLYGQQALPAPALIGGTGLEVALLRGSAVHIFAQRDDLAGVDVK